MMSALTEPLGPTVRLPFAKFTLPSTGPSTKRSSLPVISPFILIPWLMHAVAFADAGGWEGAGLKAVASRWLDKAGAMALDVSTPWGFGSSFFHIGDTSTKDFWFKSRVSSTVGASDDSD